MATNEQINANQQNSLKSTGPTSEAGKQRSALNATRHGFTGQAVALTEEEAEPYRLFTEGFLNDLAPKGTHETQLVQSIIDARWRMNQIAAMESAIYALGHRQHAEEFKNETPAMAAALSRAATFTKNQKELDRLHRYESRLHRQATKDQLSLTELQTARKALELQQWKDACALFKQFKDDRKPWNPSDFGFVWSLEEIKQRLEVFYAIQFAQRHNPFKNLVK
jgi:hypothetical protein